MNKFSVNKAMLIATLAATVFSPSVVFAFVSGSTGADGPFNPTVNTTVDLPPSGILNYTTVNIPSGVTVTFNKNVTNTPVVMLASGNVTIAGTINVNGGTATNSGAAGDGNLGDDRIPGVGGPGGYDGGAGGPPGPNIAATAELRRGGDGIGPGGGGGGRVRYDFSIGDYFPCAGGGAGFGSTGAVGGCGSVGSGNGAAYGTSILLPLVGGSGGGGGAGGVDLSGSGGGGGGGALLIASSGTVDITGTITANGGSSGATNGVNTGNPGGGGSGGAIRIVATTISGNGTIRALAGTTGNPGGSPQVTSGGAGSVGRIRLEAENITRTATSNPAHTFGAPGPVFVAGLPTLRITRVAGIDTPTQPTGNADITLPASTSNPVTVEFATTSVPVGNTVSLAVKPLNGAPINAVSPALTGSTENATASVSVNLPGGPSVLQATVSYTVVASVGDALGNQFANGERVERVTLSAAMNGPSMMTLITVSGKEYTVPSSAVAGMLGS